VPTVTLATTLSKWLPDHAAHGGERSFDLAGADVRTLLDALFAAQPALQSYVVDEHGALRHHVAMFVDGVAVADKRMLRHPVAADAKVFIAQALSGG
jgi:molybdopterin synthase sulfur carrier subunit